MTYCDVFIVRFEYGLNIVLELLMLGGNIVVELLMSGGNKSRYILSKPAAFHCRFV